MCFSSSDNFLGTVLPVAGCSPVWRIFDTNGLYLETGPGQCCIMLFRLGIAKKVDTHTIVIQASGSHWIITFACAEGLVKISLLPQWNKFSQGILQLSERAGCVFVKGNLFAAVLH